MQAIHCDYLIIGGGSAGCVLANRLSASGKHQVALIEAGRDQAPDQEEEAILDSYPRVAYFNPKNIWPELRVYLEPLNAQGGRQPTSKRYEQARIMGGGSSLNDMQANRGLPLDYDGWADSGATGWHWDAVLPYFKKLERDVDYGGPLHGTEGPIPIRRIQSKVWPKFSIAAADAMKAKGFKEIDDQNAEFSDGYFPIAISNIYDRRVSTSMGYLTPTVRSRPNLAILTDSTVWTLTFEDGKVSGAIGSGPDGPMKIHARETIVSAGALHSPALLLRSGIGPAQELRALNIPVLADRPGVGKNLQEHPALSVSAFMDPDARLGSKLRRHTHLGLRFSSSLLEAGGGDMYMVGLSKTGWHPVGQQLSSLVTWVNKPYSRGQVTLLSPRPQDEPKVEFAMLSDRRDLLRLTEGIRLAASLFEQDALKQVTKHPFPTSYSERVRDLGVISQKNAVITSILASGLDGPAWLRSALLKHAVTEGPTLERILADEEIMEGFVRTTVHGIWHPCCSCRMGDANDPLTVVSPTGKVIGVHGLRVVDASIMPSIPRANTNIPTIMLAEKISDAILEESIF